MFCCPTAYDHSAAARKEKFLSSVLFIRLKADSHLDTRACLHLPYAKAPSDSLVAMPDSDEAPFMLGQLPPIFWM
ncbi:MULTISPECIES: hypothetical protein [Pantoea]|uniref:hypothetical protein n=1 Tax=Pantoea TaxID=53335 RepID=UPI0011AF0B94|nr:MULTISPECIES: hypothetical protein [Pantoea]